VHGAYQKPADREGAICESNGAPLRIAGHNGNGHVWVEYSKSFDSGSAIQISARDRRAPRWASRGGTTTPITRLFWERERARREAEARRREAAAAAEAAVEWSAGYWQWDGSAWVWVAGSWQLPPDPLMDWQPPTWVPRAGVPVFVPGGWIKVKGSGR
jgi:hypothetical protein